METRKKIIILTIIFVGFLLISTSITATDDLFDYYNTGDTSSDNFYDDAWIGQSFTVSNNYEISSVKIKIHKTGSPAGDMYVGIRATDELGRPTGSDLTTATFPVSAITTSSLGRWEEIIFSTPYRLEEGEKYAIVARGDGANFNDFRWRRDTTSTYIGQLVKSSNAGVSWTTYEGIDLMFETYGLEYTPPMIPITADDILSALAYVGNVWEDFSALAVISMAITLGFVVIKKAIKLFPRA